MIVKHLGLQNYPQVLADMQDFTSNRNEQTPDELWIVEFDSIFTTGIKQNNYPESIHNIPVVATNRGGQITYHGKGQLVIYLLIDIKRLGLGVKKLVSLIEQSIITLLHRYHIDAHTRENMPGVYVHNKKIASLGLKIAGGKTYHGLSLNVDMDLTPFSYIHTCGYKGLEVCQMRDFTTRYDIQMLGNELATILTEHLTPQL